MTSRAGSSEGLLSCPCWTPKAALYKPKAGISCSKLSSAKVLSLAARGERDEASRLSSSLSHTCRPGDRELEFTVMGKEVTETTRDIPAKMVNPFASGCCCLFKAPMELCGRAHHCLHAPTPPTPRRSQALRAAFLRRAQSSLQKQSHCFLSCPLNPSFFFFFFLRSWVCLRAISFQVVSRNTNLLRFGLCCGCSVLRFTATHREEELMISEQDEIKKPCVLDSHLSWYPSPKGKTSPAAAILFNAVSPLFCI